jgi:hypothetical protein
MRSRICFLGATHRIEPYNSPGELLSREGYEVFGRSGSAHNLLGKFNKFFSEKYIRKNNRVKVSIQH